MYLKYVALLTLGLTSCNTKESEFFMRYKSTDAVALEKDIADQFNELKQTNGYHEKFVKSIDLAESLTVAEREDEAIEILEPYIENEQVPGEDEDLAWLYLNYATANQYDGNQQTALQYFEKALGFAKERKIENVEHYIFHHYARFLVEQKEYSHAKEHFTNALILRQKLHDARVGITQKALDTLDLIIKNQF